MSVQINYNSKNLLKNSNILTLFVDENFNTSLLKRSLSKADYIFITDLLKTKDKKEEIFFFDISSKKKIILVSFKKNITTSETENMGAKFYDKIKNTLHPTSMNTLPLPSERTSVFSGSCWSVF